MKIIFSLIIYIYFFLLQIKERHVYQFEEHVQLIPFRLFCIFFWPNHSFFLIRSNLIEYTKWKRVSFVPSRSFKYDLSFCWRISFAACALKKSKEKVFQFCGIICWWRPTVRRGRGIWMRGFSGGIKTCSFIPFYYSLSEFFFNFTLFYVGCSV